MHYDAIIVGAGPVGAALALAISDCDLNVLALDARPRGASLRGDRSIALSHGARLIFERLQVWCDLATVSGSVTPITSVDVSQVGGFGTTHLSAREQGVPALGYVVPYTALQAALDRALDTARVAVRYDVDVTSVGATSAYAAVRMGDGVESLTARLVVVADGGTATVPGVSRRREDYGQVAVTARVWTARPHGGVAYERFTPDGPLALLPEGDHYGVVWTQLPAQAASTMSLSDADFLRALAEAFGDRAGAFTRVAARRSFPLALEVAYPTTLRRTVLIGNAAQALHPVAGQGFNLGLRDAWDLGRTIGETPREELGGDRMLARYARRRRVDRRGEIALTHGLVRAFSGDDNILRWVRGAGLALLDAMPLAKQAFTRAMLFGVRL
ncbi:MAG TPA: FAD-dependent monooxygenase [Casimicrobiaceae bacterium]|nr:FAD-dependent monooxygenase [Casimicrobiaceae bacterium]